MTKPIAAMAAALLALFCAAAQAGAPLKINFQGRLDENGAPAEGSKTFVFKLYDASSGGSLVWTSASQALTLSQGVFSAALDAGTPAAISTASFSGARWLEVTVDGVTLSPRQELMSAPYALVAQALAPDAELPASTIADGSVTDAKVALSTAAISSGRFTDLRVQISTGAVASGRFSDDRVLITTGAFTGGFNAADQLVRLDGTARLPAVDGSQLTGLPVPSGAVSRTGDTMTGQLTLAGSTLTVTGSAFSVGGTLLTAGAGKVGVGTASPGYLLDVQGGSVNASGGLCIADNCKSSWASVDNLGNHTASQALNMAGYSIHNVSTLTVAGAEFSVGGTALSVGGGKVGVSTGTVNSALTLGGAISLPIRTVTNADTPYTLGGDDHTILADGSGGGLALVLPDPAQAAGRIYVVKTIGGANAITLDTSGAGLDGTAGTYTFVNDWETLVIQSDGIAWYRLESTASLTPPGPF